MNRRRITRTPDYAHRLPLYEAALDLAETFQVTRNGCDRASAKDFHEIRAVFTRGVA
jgi:hypothetical protein